MLAEVQPRRAGTERLQCIRVEGFGCDPAKIVAKIQDMSGQLSVTVKAWELNVRTGRDNPACRRAGNRGMRSYGVHG